MAKKFSGTNEEWDALVLNAGAQNNAWGFVLQSSKWADVLVARGARVVRIVDESNQPSLWTLLKITHGIWVWYCPKGPIVLPEHANEWRALISVLQHERHATVLRIEPTIAAPENFKKRKSISPTHSLITLLGNNFESLFKSFHEKTRYNIRVAEKHGVRAVRLTGEMLHQQLHRILSLYTATGERHGISSMPAAELRALVATADVWVAWYENRIIATSFHVGFGDTYTYLHGASSYDDRALMGPYALHAAAMQYAIEQSFARYDWWGVAPENDETHPLAGVTRFKLGFGGSMVSAPGTFDLGIDRLRYSLYTWGVRAAKRMRS